MKNVGLCCGHSPDCLGVHCYLVHSVQVYEAIKELASAYEMHRSMLNVDDCTRLLEAVIPAVIPTAPNA